MYDPSDGVCLLLLTLKPAFEFLTCAAPQNIVLVRRAKLQKITSSI